MKDVELKLIAELMKNSRRSDRDLAKAIGTSQPTVTRIRNKLEKEGHIREYTIIPDFCKLGYNILALTFAKLRKAADSDSLEKARKIAKESLKELPFPFVMIERGIGCSFDGVIVSYHEDYSSYVKMIQWVKSKAYSLELSDLESFIIDLRDTVRYMPLTFSNLAKLLLTQEKTKHK